MVTDLKGASLSEIISIVNEVGPQITTNLKKDEIMGLVSNALTYIDYEIVQNYAPKEGLWYYNNPWDESWDIGAHTGAPLLIFGRTHGCAPTDSRAHTRVRPY